MSFLKRQMYGGALVFRGMRWRNDYPCGVNPCRVLAVLTATVLCLGEIAAPVTTCRAGVKLTPR